MVALAAVWSAGVGGSLVAAHGGGTEAVVVDPSVEQHVGDPRDGDPRDGVVTDASTDLAVRAARPGRAETLRVVTSAPLGGVPIVLHRGVDTSIVDLDHPASTPPVSGDVAERAPPT